MIKTGELNQRIEIMAMESVSDGAGGTVDTEVVYWSTSARVKPIKSSSYLQANQESLKDGFDITVRYRIDKIVKPDMRIKYRSGYLTITSAPTDYVDKVYLNFKAVWSQRPETTEPAPQTLYAYYGYLDEGEVLTEQKILSGQSFGITNNGSVTVPFNTSDFKLLWLALPSGQTVKQYVTDIGSNEVSPIGLTGTFASKQTIGAYDAYISNFPTIYSGAGLTFSSSILIPDPNPDPTPILNNSFDYSLDFALTS